MLFRRWLNSSIKKEADREIEKLIDKIKTSHIPELPLAQTITLSSQDLSGKVGIDKTKSPLVMIHGLFGARQNYSSVGRKLSAQTLRQTIGVDMRNHGGSQHVFPHDYQHMARDTIQYIESLGREVVLAGHSMGAKVSMLVALQRPDLVEKLIVIDNSPKSEILDDRFTRDLLAMCRVESELHYHGKNQAQLLKDVDSLMASYEPDALVRIFLASNLKRPTRKIASFSEKVKFRVPVKNFLKHDILSNMGHWPAHLVENKVFDKPVLVMRGLQSEFIQDSNLEKCFPNYFSNFRVVNFDCGHWLVSEQPDRFIDKTIEFLV